MAVVIIVDSRGEAVHEARRSARRIGQAAGRASGTVVRAGAVVMGSAANWAGTRCAGRAFRRLCWNGRRHRQGWRRHGGRCRTGGFRDPGLLGARVPGLVRHQMAGRIVDHGIRAAGWDGVVHAILAIASTPGRHVGKVRLVSVGIETGRPERFTDVEIATAGAGASTVAGRWRHGRPTGQGTGNDRVVVELGAKAAEVAEVAEIDVALDGRFTGRHAQKETLRHAGVLAVGAGNVLPQVATASDLSLPTTATLFC